MADVSLIIKLLAGILGFVFCITTPFLVKRTITNHLRGTEYFLAYQLDEQSFSCDDWVEDNTDNPIFFIMHPVSPDEVTDHDLKQIEANITAMTIVKED